MALTDQAGWNCQFPVYRLGLPSRVCFLLRLASILSLSWQDPSGFSFSCLLPILCFISAARCMSISDTEQVDVPYRVGYLSRAWGEDGHMKHLYRLMSIYARYQARLSYNRRIRAGDSYRRIRICPAWVRVYIHSYVPACVRVFVISFGCLFARSLMAFFLSSLARLFVRVRAFSLFFVCGLLVSFFRSPTCARARTYPAVETPCEIYSMNRLTGYTNTISSMQHRISGRDIAHF